WYEDDWLRNAFFAYLSRTGKINAELQTLKKDQYVETDWAALAKANPAAVRFVAEAELWQSHFEQGSPALGALAMAYPAEAGVGKEASSVYRSLAYFNPKNAKKP